MSTFEIEVPDAELADLRERLRNTRLPAALPGGGWDYGTDVGYLADLLAYWRDAFDWRAQEARLNELPNHRVEIDGRGLHFVHARGVGPSPYPLVISHGWPSSFYEMTKLIPLLTDPGAYGGNPADAFDVVVPSLPGFGFSDPPRERGLWPRNPELFRRLMTDVLGYERFGAHGGDLGSGISARLGAYHADVVDAIHVTGVTGSGESAGRHQEERAAWQREESAYARLQGTKPQTLAIGLDDSPAGLASWIVEKWRAWSDCGGDVESRFTKDELLTTITLYWATRTIGTSFLPYWDSQHGYRQPVRRVDVPCGVAVFPADLERPPREWAERTYNVQRFTEMPRGGHFAAFEEPELLADDLRAFFRGIRP